MRFAIVSLAVVIEADADGIANVRVVAAVGTEKSLMTIVVR